MSEDQAVRERRREDILRKVRALIDKADSTNFSAERDSLLAKADAMMAAYAIESFELEFARPAQEREKPDMRKFEYGRTGVDVADSTIYEIFYKLARHCKVMIGYYGYTHSKVVGYKADLEYLDMLFTSVKLHLAMNLEPRPQPDLSEYENFVLLKEAGMKWQRIWELLHPGEPFNRSHCQKLLRRYGDECKAQGREQVKGHPDIYRRSFMDGYKYKLGNRIRQMQAARDEATKGHEITLYNMENDLKEFFWEMFPDQRPHPANCECDGCHVVKCRDPKCTRPICVSARKPVRVRSTRYHEPKIDYSAMRAGERAAENFDLAGRDRKVGGDRKEIE